MAFSLTPVSGFSVNKNSKNDLNIFWGQFRQAVIEKKIDQVAALTQFPLEIHGTLDSQKIKKISREEFSEWFIKLLEQPIYSVKSDGTPLKSRTMEQVIRDQINLPSKNKSSKNRFRFEQFQFEQIEGQWRLVLAYWEE